MKKNDIRIMEDLGTISEDMKLPFPLYEYKNRLNKIRLEMQEMGIDLLYLTMPESMYYVSGLNLNWYQMSSSSSWDSSKATGVAIHVDYDKFLLFQIPDEEGAVLGATCCTDPRIKDDTPGNPIMFGRKFEAPAQGEQSLIDLIVNDLKEENWLEGTVALEFGSPRPNYAVMTKLRECFEKNGCSKVVDGTDIVRKIRGRKSSIELSYIRKASILADIGYEAIANGLREGMTELELVAEYTSAMMRAGGESMAIVDQVGFGKGKVWWVHSQAGRKQLMKGDWIRVDLCGVYNRYHANQARMLSFGEADEELADMYSKNEIIMQKVKEIIRPDMYINDFYCQLEQFFRKEGFWGEQYWLGGYELGIGFPPDWCGSFVYDPFIDAKDARFEAGMVVNFETGFGLVDTLMFTEKEATVLGNTPWKLQVIEP